MTVLADNLVGQVVAGRYQVIRKIGRGGMGSIYEVRHTRLGRSFALKALAADLSRDAEALARFQREAETIAKLRHPSIVEVVDWDMLADGSPCMVMELLSGEDLAAHIRRRGPLPWPSVARTGDAVLSALSAAHRAGITHRDIKPQNIFLATDDSGEVKVKLLDFGLSKVQESTSGLTGDQQMLGTPAHMAPEQIDGATERIGPASDVWSMATVLYEMATARPAFRGANVPAILYQVCHGTAPSVSSLRSDTPPAFDDLVRRALSRDLPERTCSIERLRAELRAALGPLAPGLFVDRLGDGGVDVAVTQSMAPATPSPSTMTRASGQLQERALAVKSPARRRALPLAATMAVLALAIVAVAGYLATRDDDRTAAPGPSAAEGPAPAPATTPAPATAIAVTPAGIEKPDAQSVAADAGALIAPQPVIVQVRIESIPTKALVWDGKRQLGRTPLRLKTTMGSLRQLRLQRDGYEEEVVRMDGSLARVRVTMARKTHAPRPSLISPRDHGPRVPKPEDIYGTGGKP